MLESEFKRDTLKKIEIMFPGCFIMKNDPNFIQGVPDTTILWGVHWAVLEFKRSAYEKYRANQEHYLGLLDAMSFAAMICPENEEEILDALQRSFSTRRSTRLSKSK